MWPASRLSLPPLLEIGVFVRKRNCQKVRSRNCQRICSRLCQTSSARVTRLTENSPPSFSSARMSRASSVGPKFCQLADSWLASTGIPVASSILLRISGRQASRCGKAIRRPLTSSAAITTSAAPVSSKIPGNRLTRHSLSAKNVTQTTLCRMAAQHLFTS